MRPWLDLVDELRAHGISQDLPLPQIAVMGDQSCGKSSVLEVSGINSPSSTIACVDVDVVERDTLLSAYFKSTHEM